MKSPKFLVKSILLFSITLFIQLPLFADDPCDSSQAPGYCFSRLNDSTVSEARETTDRAMALPNRLAENDFNAINNPAHLVNYGTAYLEGWGGSQYAWGGATIPLPGDWMKLGIFLRRPISERHPFLTMLSDPTKVTSAQPANQDAAKIKYNAKVPALTDLGTFDGTGAQKRGFGNVDVFLGMSLTSSINLGIRLGYLSASKTEEDTATTTKSDSSLQEPSVGLGVQMKNVGPGYLDIAASFSLPSVKYDASTATNTYVVKNKFAYTTNALVRYVLPVGQNRLITAFSADLYNTPVEATDSTAAGSHTRTSTTGYSAFALDAGFYQNFSETKLKVIYSAGAGLINWSFDHKTDSVTGTGGPDSLATNVDNKHTQSQFYIPLGVAIEHQTLESMKTRIGVRKNVVSAKSYETAVNGTITKKQTGHFAADDELMLAMGLGWTPASKVNIDLAMNANAFKLDTFFTAISIRYHY